jgi:hypothetical protein
MGRNSNHPQGSQPSHSSGGRLDDQRQREESGVVQGGHSSRAEEWRDPQAPAEGEPRVSWTPDVPEQPGTPVGMTNEDVQRRSEIARFLGKEVWPAGRDALVAKAEENGAPDGVLADLRGLPPEGEFANLQDVARSLGVGTEEAPGEQAQGHGRAT